MPKGRKVNETFKQGVAVFEPHSLHYNPKARAAAVLQGNYQKIYEPVLQKLQPTTPIRAEIEGRETKAIKQAMLASNHFETGTSSLEHYVNQSSK